MKRALVGLIGANIGKSLSPALHDDAFDAAGIRGHYHLMDLDAGSGRSLPVMLSAARTAGFLGVNITYPCKEAVLPLLDEVSAEARQIGAVNTVTIAADGRTTGYNTDRSGFRRSFEDSFGRMAVDGATVLLIGAGGAGAAVAFALADLGVKALLIHDKDRARATSLGERLSANLPIECIIAADPEAALALAAGVVNATPVGMLGIPGIPLPPAGIEPRHFVADVIYTPLETELVVAARARGAAAAGGAGMCVYQAAEAFRLFTGIEPDIARMYRTFTSAASQRAASLAAAQ